jgi:hypothetical protein
MAGAEMGSVLDKSTVDALMRFSHVLGNDYSGRWQTASRFLITVTDARNNTGINFDSGFYVQVRAAGNLLDARESSVESVARSNSLTVGR